MVMADPNYAALPAESPDDLPRTFRREKEAREREARERAARERAAAPSLSMGPATDPYAAAAQAATPMYAEPAPAGSISPVIGDVPMPAVVRAIDVPFGQLAAFFLKAVIAAIPAMLLLMAILWGIGSVLEILFPSLVKMKILIGVG